MIVRILGEGQYDIATTSHLVLPGSDADLAEVAALLGDEGLIPG